MREVCKKFAISKMYFFGESDIIEALCRAMHDAIEAGLEKELMELGDDAIAEYDAITYDWFFKTGSKKQLLAALAASDWCEEYGLCYRSKIWRCRASDLQKKIVLDNR